MRGVDIKCEHITNILYALPSSCVNLVESRGFILLRRYNLELWMTSKRSQRTPGAGQVKILK